MTLSSKNPRIPLRNPRCLIFRLGLAVPDQSWMGSCFMIGQFVEGTDAVQQLIDPGGKSSIFPSLESFSRLGQRQRLAQNVKSHDRVRPLRVLVLVARESPSMTSSIPLDSPAIDLISRNSSHLQAHYLPIVGFTTLHRHGRKLCLETTSLFRI
jgi:hypothetical protein